MMKRIFALLLAAMMLLMPVMGSADTWDAIEEALQTSDMLGTQFPTGDVQWVNIGSGWFPVYLPVFVSTDNMTAVDGEYAQVFYGSIDDTVYVFPGFVGDINAINFDEITITQGIYSDAQFGDMMVVILEDGATVQVGVALEAGFDGLNMLYNNGWLMGDVFADAWKDGAIVITNSNLIAGDVVVNLEENADGVLLNTETALIAGNIVADAEFGSSALIDNDGIVEGSVIAEAEVFSEMAVENDGVVMGSVNVEAEVFSEATVENGGVILEGVTGDAFIGSDLAINNSGIIFGFAFVNTATGEVVDAGIPGITVSMDDTSNLVINNTGDVAGADASEVNEYFFGELNAEINLFTANVDDPYQAAVDAVQDVDFGLHDDVSHSVLVNVYDYEGNLLGSWPIMVNHNAFVEEVKTPERIRHDMEEKRKAAAIDGVTGSPFWLKQAFINYMSLNLRVYQDGNQINFKEFIKRDGPVNKALTLMVNQEEPTGLTIRFDEKVLAVLENAKITTITLADKNLETVITYNVSDLRAAYEQYGLNELDQLVVGGTEDPVMMIGEDGEMKPVEA